jgi:protein-S-isoprenylcysteine O-methyltransferase Ste14
VQNSPQSLSRRAFAATAKFLVVLGLLIFLWSNFALWCVAFTPYFLKHDPALLERRLRAGPAAEREPTQKRIQLFASIFVCALFAVSVLDHRLGWSTVPISAVLVGNVLVAAGFWFMFVVFRENSFASSIIEVGADQKVIDTGPYAVLRHPMYAGALLMFAGVPPALGSWWGLVILPPIAAILAIRLLDEEKFLLRNLPGYAEYRTKVRYRLLPGVW